MLHETREILYLDCPHKKLGITTDVELPDYHPISPYELAGLMIVATDTRDHELRNSIHIRLNKAVPGMTCPHPIEGATAEKSYDVDELYMNEIKNGRTHDFIDKFFAIINR